jgi:DNA polymerase I
MNSEKKLFLLDAYALIFRAYYAFINRQMFNSKGLNTSAVFGFTVTLDEVLRDYFPTHIGVVFDPPSPTFRHKMYEPYKATREETPEEIKKAVPFIKEIINGFNIPVVEVEGYEADDVIGTLAKQAEKQGFKVFMMTPDKDFSQLVSGNIFMFKPRKSGEKPEILGVREINDWFQIKDPLQVIDIMALWGDSSDNVPGAPGIGEKTAKKLISEYGSLENLFENAQNLKGKQKESILNFKDQIILSKKLVTIDINVPFKFSSEEFKLKSPDIDKLNKVFKELEFRTIAERIIGSYTKKSVQLPSGNEKEYEESAVKEKEDRSATFLQNKRPEKSEIGPEKITQQGLLFNAETADSERLGDSDLATIKTTEHKYYICDTPGKISELSSILMKLDAFCFDTETTDLNAINAELVGMSFSFKPFEAYYIPFTAERKQTIQRLNFLIPLFENEKILKVGQNIKYDLQVLNNYNVRVKGRIFDTMIAHYLLQPELRHNLNYLSESYLKYKPVAIEELIGKKGSEQGNMKDVPLALISEYASEDADLTWQLYRIFSDRLIKEGLNNLAESIEFPLIQVISDMEINGVKLDTDSLKSYGSQLTGEINQLEKEIYDLADQQFNIASPKQLGEILFDKLKISKDAKRTKTKIYSTNEEVLLELADKHPIIPKILEYRSLTKLLSTYVEALPKMVNPVTGKIHTSFNQAIVATGRLSSNNPNLQNIPVRDAKGREIRKAFISSGPDNILLSADYSQIELRLMAHMSKDENMLNAFRNNEDIHLSTAAKIYNVPAENVTREMRSRAKTANFGIIYGISAFGLSQRLHISRTEAKDLIDGYFRSYPEVKKYMEDIIKIAREKGYVETLLGRRRYLNDINSHNSFVRGFAERNAINAPLQGTAADIIKIAMINIHRKLEAEKLNTKMILQVHDELVFDVYKPELEKVKELVKQEMENAYNLDIPLVVDTGMGSNWLEAH